MKQERDIGTPAAVRNELPKSYHNVFDVTFMFHSSFIFLLMLIVSYIGPTMDSSTFQCLRDYLLYIWLLWQCTFYIEIV